MKKKLMALMMVLAMIFSIAACGTEEETGGDVDSGDSTEGQSSEEEEAEQGEEEIKEGYEPTYGEVEIEFWCSSNTDACQELAERYMEEHPNVTINVLAVSFWDYESKLIPALAAETAPDIFQGGLGGAPGRASAEQIVNIQEALEIRGYDESKYLTTALEECKYEGDLYAMPFVTDTRLFYYNKDAFAEVGLDPEQPPKTWEEVYEYTKLLTTFDENGNVERLGFNSSLGNCWPWVIMWTYGAELFDGETPVFNCQETYDAAEMMKQIQDVYGYDNYLAFSEVASTMSYSPFISGELAMVIEMESFPNTIATYNPELNWGVATLPTVDGENYHSSWNGGQGLEFTNHGEDRLNAAIDFGLYLCSDEAQEYILERDSTFVCNLDAFAKGSEYHPEYGEQYWNAMEETAPYSKFIDNHLAYPGYNADIAVAWDYVMRGEKTCEEAFSEAEQHVIQETENYHQMNE